MFTLAMISAAHQKVKSGADFPLYIQDLIQLGITSYSTYVSDGHTDYYGPGHTATADARYPPLPIADTAAPAAFQADLKAHQQGLSTYPVFCSDCARSGVEKWTVDMAAMTCTYYDKSGQLILAELIPTP